MKIIAITGKFGSGKSFFSKKLNNELNSSMVVNLDNIFFELLNNDQDIKKQLFKSMEKMHIIRIILIYLLYKKMKKALVYYLIFVEIRLIIKY